MIPLFDLNDIENLPNMLGFECKQCHKPFLVEKKYVKGCLKKTHVRTIQYCSNTCRGKAQITSASVTCAQCNIVFNKRLGNIKKTKNNFCSSSCAATYNNQHKKFGIRRSKLEKWLETQLPALYPSLEFHWARKDAINSELDIYIPSLKLAFELNGIFHYEPIFGAEQLAKIQNNDQRKHAACYEAGIEMCWIDTSSFGYFKPEGAMKYLDIITAVIDKRLANC